MPESREGGISKECQGYPRVLVWRFKRMFALLNRLWWPCQVKVFIALLGYWEQKGNCGPTTQVVGLTRQHPVEIYLP